MDLCGIRPLVVLLLCILYVHGNPVFPNRPDLFEGDIKLTAVQEKAVKKAIKNQASIESGASKFGLTNVYPPWKGGVVVYSYAPSIGYRQRTPIEAAMREWTTKTGGCISFKRRTSERNYLEFHVGSGCWGHIGQPNGKSQISVGSGCEYQHVMSHEIGHALGFWHEQSRTDRDSYIQILWQNVPAQFKEAFAKYGKDKIDSLGVPYDYTSIMHYPWNAFSTTGRDTVKPLRRVPNPGPYKYISASDVEQAKRFYKCGKTPVVTQRPPPATKCVTETVNAGYDASCRDLNRNCAYWARNGQCRANPAYMRPNCCKSCNAGGSSCVDKHGSCAYWARTGQCRSNPGYMHLNCKKSCRLCSTTKTRRRCFTVAPPVTTTTTPKPETGMPPIPTDNPHTGMPPIPTDKPDTGMPPIPTDKPNTGMPPVPVTGKPPTKPQPPPTPDDCKNLVPLGTSDPNKIKDSAFSAETSESRWHAPYFGRLGQKNDEKSVGAWCAAIQDKNQFFQVTMDDSKLLGGLKIQGRPSQVNSAYQKFVTKFEINYWNENVNDWIGLRDESDIWVEVNKVFDGNTDGNTVKEIKFAVPIKTSMIRIKPTEWQHMICLRLELMTCA